MEIGCTRVHAYLKTGCMDLPHYLSSPVDESDDRLFRRDPAMLMSVP